MSESYTYTKIKDSWYAGPYQRNGVPAVAYHAHAISLFSLHIVQEVSGWENVNTYGIPVYRCNDCGAIVPDEVADVLLLTDGQR